MILFKPVHIPMIMAEPPTKTQTRRPFTTQKRYDWWKIGSKHVMTTGYRKDKQFGKMQLIAKRKERLGDITEEDARKEGYASVEAFKKIWIEIYGEWTPELDVIVLDFEVVIENE